MSWRMRCSKIAAMEMRTGLSNCLGFVALSMAVMYARMRVMFERELPSIGSNYMPSLTDTRVTRLSTNISSMFE